MIEKIRLKNFESHKDTELDLHPGINVIVGESDSGKSSILRSVNLVAENKPSGDNFINHFSEKCEVELCVKGKSIKRIKGKNKNLYKIDKDKFEAFGQGVPDEVNDILNMDELNMQDQFDKHFLISKSSGEVARVLNKIINLEEIDGALSGIEKLKKGFKKKYEDSEASIQEYTNDISNLSWVKDALKKIEILKAKSEKFERKKISRDSIKETISEIEKCEIESMKLNKILKFEKKILSLKKNSENLDYKISKRDELKNSIENFEDLNSKILKQNSIIDSEKIVNKIKKSCDALEIKIEKKKELEKNIEKIELYEMKISKENEKLKFEKPLLKIKKSIVQFAEKIYKRNSIVEIINKSEVLNSKINILVDKIKELKNKLKEYKDQFDVCPFCGKEI